jgi:benzoylformate decarboxylase
MTSRTASDVLVEAFSTEGVTAVFGNPGTTELPLMEALAGHGEPRFYLGLQEIVCLGMADGYAQATGRPGVVNLHASPGLGNAMGNLYNAWRTGTPLVVTAGQQDTRFNLDAPLLHSDVVRQAAQYSKWSWELRRADELPAAVRRAFKEATTPPTGPTFLSLPMDLLSEASAAKPAEPARVQPAGVPPRPLLERAAGLLERSERPVVVAGDRLHSTGARSAAVALAEHLGAPVWAEPMAGRLPFPPEHPQFAGFLPPFGPLVKRMLGDADLVLLLGAEAFLLYPPFEPGSPFPDGCAIVHIDDSPAHLARSQAPDVALVSDLEAGARDLLAGLGEPRAERRDALVGALAKQRAKLLERGRLEMVERPRTPAAVATAVSEATHGRPVVDEAVSMTGALQRSWPLKPPSERYGHRAGGLGWGLPAALGVSLARPRERTVALLGDGSVMYAVQGLWTAARYGLNVTFVVLANDGYEIIRAGLRRQAGPSAAAGTYVGTDLKDPPIDWAAVAVSMGLAFRSCDDAGAIPEAARELERTDGPGLLEVTVEGEFTLP